MITSGNDMPPLPMQPDPKQSPRAGLRRWFGEGCVTGSGAGRDPWPPAGSRLGREDRGPPIQGPGPVPSTMGRAV